MNIYFDTLHIALVGFLHDRDHQHQTGLVKREQMCDWIGDPDRQHQQIDYKHQYHDHQESWSREKMFAWIGK